MQDPKFKDYKVTWCDLCETPVILCQTCHNSSCNGGGCEVCNKDFDEFNKTTNNYIRSDFYCV